VTRPAAAVYDLVLQARLLAGKDARAPLLEARALLLRAVESEPHYVPAQLALADTYLAVYVRRWDDADGTPETLDAAMRAIDEVLALTPQSPAARAMRAAVLAHLGRHDEAVAAVDQVVGARDADAATLDRAAQVLLLAGQSHKALALLERARTADPVPSPAAMATQARAEILLGRDAAAANTAEACLARAATEHDCLETAAAALARQGRLDSARSMLDKLRAIDPAYGTDTLRRRFARSYRQAGDIEAVVMALGKVRP
jgi:tetratricopeptide (TPR) repeat protein